MSDIKRVLTENPLIDEIVYECQHIIKGIVLKDEALADSLETAETLRNADIYNDIICGTDRYEYYTFTYDMFMKLPGMTSSRALLLARGQLPVPEGQKLLLQKIAREDWIANYEEKNNYYRSLAGLPDIGDDFIYLTDDDMLLLPVESFDINTPVHECNEGEAELLYNNGVIDRLKERYPDAKYLDHLGEKSIDPYLARHTAKFGLLYMPPVDSPEVTDKWRERFEINRVYVLQTIYSEAYKFQSDYYDRFMMIMIVMMTFEDMIVYSPEYIIERNLFDFRTIEYIFEACGVKYFPDIPLKYQKRLVKNLNRLIKYKSSAKCMVDIVSLFGYENMELFKYYILKIPLLDENGNYKDKTYTDPETGKEVEDLESNYKLQFLKVPLLEIADDYIQDPFQYVDYDETAGEDIWWNGVYTKKYVKHKILEHEFNIHKSKYISIDTVYSLTELQFQMVYFMNMLLYSGVNTDKLLVDVPEISSNIQFKLTDLIYTLFSLNYLYNHMTDNIVYNPVQVMDVKGFNFNTDLTKLSSYLEEKGYTLEDVGLDTFRNPKQLGIQSWKDLEEIYNGNISTYKTLVDLMRNANNKDEYDVYRTVYESLFITRLNFEEFKKTATDNKLPKRYIDYLRHTNIMLYNLVVKCQNIQKDTEQRQEITRTINYIVEDIYCFLDKDIFKFAFNGIATVNLDYVRKYIYNILNFFKSYKVDIIHSNTIYKFDDRLENRINIIDKIIFKYIFNKSDRVSMKDCFDIVDNFNWKENIEILDQIHLDITYWKNKKFYDNIITEDRWKQLMVHLKYKDYVNITRDIITEYNHVYNWNLHIPTVEELHPIVRKVFKDEIGIADNFIYE